VTLSFEAISLTTSFGLIL